MGEPQVLDSWLDCVIENNSSSGACVEIIFYLWLAAISGDETPIYFYFALSYLNMV